MNAITTKEDIEQCRTPSEYISWFDPLLESTRDVSQSDEHALLHKGLYKEFYEEIFPTARLLRLKISDWADCRFKNVLGSQHYDVEIGSNETLSYLEISCTTFDDGEYFKMTSFLNGEIVDPAGNVIRNNRNKPIDIESPDRDAFVLGQVKLIHNRVTNKLRKKYPEKTGLLILYDDISRPFKPDHYAKIKSVCDSLQRSWKSKFVSLFAVGITGKHLIEL